MSPQVHGKVRISPGGNPIEPQAFGLTKAAYSVNETLDLLSIGRTSLYKLVSCGALRPAKLGKKTLFFASDIAAFLTKLKEAA
jgi:predicted DNA-binding transcriptional regulator AlpA